MICPECQTPNPNGVEVCPRCARRLSDPEKTLRLEEADPSAMPTLAGPASLKEWVKSPSTGAAVSLVLSDGLEIGRRYRVRKLLGVGGK